MAIASFSVIGLCSLFLLILWNQNGQGVPGLLQSLLVLFFIFVIEFAISN